MNGRWGIAFILVAALVIVALGLRREAAVGDDSNGVITLVSRHSNGSISNGFSDRAAISGNGRYIGFHSDADNLVSDDSNNANDIFVREWLTGETFRVSLSSTEEEGNSDSSNPSLSEDGRYVAFSSYSSNLAGNDTNERSDVFVRDLQTGETSLISVGLSGSPGNGSSFWPSISADGRFVAFASQANDLVNNDSNGQADIFVRDQSTSQTIPVSIGLGGELGHGSSIEPQISADGKSVVFTSSASNLVNNDTNDAMDVFVRDLVTEETERVSITSDGGESSGSFANSEEPSISGDGRLVAFTSRFGFVSDDGNDGPDVYLRDRATNKTIAISVRADGLVNYPHSYGPAISANGRWVSFYSQANQLVNNDTNDDWDIFVRDLQSQTTQLISVAADGGEANGFMVEPAISSEGWRVAFASEATNLVADDPNDERDIFLYDLTPHIISGKVVEQGTGNPLADVTVWSGENWSTKTASDGTFILEVPAGTHDVRAQNPLWITSPLFRQVTVPPNANAVDYQSEPAGFHLFLPSVSS